MAPPPSDPIQSVFPPVHGESGHAYTAHRASRLFRKAAGLAIVLGIFPWVPATFTLYALSMLLCAWAWMATGGLRKRRGTAQSTAIAVVGGAVLSTAWLVGSAFLDSMAIWPQLGAAAMVLVDVAVVGAVMHAIRLTSITATREARPAAIASLMGLLAILAWRWPTLPTAELELSILAILLTPGALLAGYVAIFRSAKLAAPKPSEAVPGWLDALQAVGLAPSEVQWTAWGAEAWLDIDGRRVRLRLSTDRNPQQVEVAVELGPLPEGLWMTPSTLRPSEVPLSDPILQHQVAVGGVGQATARSLLRDLHGPLLDCFLRPTVAGLANGWLVSRQLVAETPPDDLLRREDFRAALDTTLGPALALAEELESRASALDGPAPSARVQSRRLPTDG